MNRAVLAIIVLSACVSEEPEVTSTASQGLRGKCSSEFCGMNSAVLDDGFFHELNLDGLTNQEGYSILSLIKNGSTYKLDLVNGRFYATLTSGLPGAPKLPTVPKLPLQKAPTVPKSIVDLTSRMRDGQQSSLELLLFGGFA